MDKNYEAGRRFGRKAIKDNYQNFGDLGLGQADKGYQTCMSYATDKKIKKTKKGKRLTNSLRSFYRGMADGFQDGYNDLF